MIHDAFNKKVHQERDNRNCIIHLLVGPQGQQICGLSTTKIALKKEGAESCIKLVGIGPTEIVNY